jgi:hypothetical protein
MGMRVPSGSGCSSWSPFAIDGDSLPIAGGLPLVAARELD